MAKVPQDAQLHSGVAGDTQGAGCIEGICSSSSEEIWNTGTCQPMKALNVCGLFTLSNSEAWPHVLLCQGVEQGA